MESENHYTLDRSTNVYVPECREGTTFREMQIILHYTEKRKMLSVKFPTQHMFCKACGSHWLKCCYTEFNPVCVNPINCAFEKEIWSA